MSSIFISYSRKDQAYVGNLVHTLEKYQLPVWLDNRVDYGTTWPRIIQEHLEQCQVFLLVMSPRSEKSHWVQCEVALALELRKPIFPLLLDGKRWLSVAAIQTVDIRGGKLPPNRFFETVGKYFKLLPKVSIITPEVDDLASERGVNYTRLRDLLETQKFFKDADDETYLRMLEVVGRKEGDWIRDKELLSFPCIDLKTIDCLWRKYSQDRFGFSVQKEIYAHCGAQLDGNYAGDEVWKNFGAQVGWYVNDSWISYQEITFDTSAPRGHLPVWRGAFWGFTWRGGWRWREEGVWDDSHFAGSGSFCSLVFKFEKCSA